MTPELPTIVGQSASIDVLTSDIKTLEALLRNGQSTSRCLLEAYLAQIEKHDDYLHAMIQVTPRELLFERADSLDKGRRADAISEKDSAFSFTSSLTGSWSDISVGTLDPSKWMFPVSSIKPVPMASEQICEDTTNAYEIVKGKAKSFTANVPLPSIESFKLNGTYSDVVVMRADLKKELNAYLQDLEESQVRTLQDIIDFNIEHATEELPPHHPRQDEFLKTQEQQISPEDYEQHLAHLRSAATVDGIDRILDEYGLDVILGPADSFITSFATGSGYPIAAMPLSYLRFNGRPLGVAAIARKNQDALLVKVMSAWEATFPPRKPPRLAE
ncbi:hypothetical protein SLS63_002219 [Diaporthe eres]|uniref:Amidase domain-containing protein n=1 Tax=Diaporthe eres TaxID=83184 RepID=A0ABR1PKY2_DIAER